MVALPTRQSLLKG